eukprot:14555547-Ditylum_brightwellii.AAC.1
MKDLNTFFNNKVDVIIKDYKKDLHAMSGFEDLSISLSNESIISVTLAESSDNKDHKPVTKK